MERNWTEIKNIFKTLSFSKTNTKIFVKILCDNALAELHSSRIHLSLRLSLFHPFSLLVVMSLSLQVFLTLSCSAIPTSLHPNYCLQLSESRPNILMPQQNLAQ